MSDEPWRTKPQMLAHLNRSERTLQVMVREGRVERRVGEDKRAYYRVTQRDAAVQRDAASPPPWAVELLEEIRALRSEIAAHNAPQRELAASTDEPPARSEPQPRSEPQRVPWWKRLFSPE